MLYQQQEKLRPAFRLTGIFILVLLITLTLIRNYQWSSAVEHIETEIRHHPLSYRANDKLAKELMKVGKFAEAEVVLQNIKFTKRPFANHYFNLLITKHIANQGISEEYFLEMEDALANQRVHPDILNEFKLYLSNADTYNWSDPKRSIVFADALSRNRFLHSNSSKGRLSLILAKLYGDIGDYESMLQHMEIAHKQFPKDKSLAKLYDDVLTNKIQRIEIVP